MCRQQGARNVSIGGGTRHADRHGALRSVRVGGYASQHGMLLPGLLDVWVGWFLRLKPSTLDQESCHPQLASGLPPHDLRDPLIVFI